MGILDKHIQHSISWSSKLCRTQRTIRNEISSDLCRRFPSDTIYIHLSNVNYLPECVVLINMDLNVIMFQCGGIDSAQNLSNVLGRRSSAVSVSAEVVRASLCRPTRRMLCLYKNVIFVILCADKKNTHNPLYWYWLAITLVETLG